MRFFRTLSERFLGNMDFRQMPPLFRKLAKMELFHSAASSLQALYLSSLLIRVTGNTDMNLFYSMVLYNAATLGHLIGTVLVRRFPAVYSARLSAVMYLGMYATLLFGMDHLGILWFLVGIFAGLGAAFNYMAYMTLLLECTEDNTRDRSLSYMTLQGSLLSLFLPTIGGALITFVNDSTGSEFVGYVVLYSICSLVLVLMVLATVRIPAKKPEIRHTYFREVLRDMRSNPDCRRMMAMDAVVGFRDGTLSFFINVLFFVLVTSELLSGLKSFGASILAIVAAFVAGRWLRPERRILSMTVGITLMMAVALMMFVSFSPITILILSLCSSLLTSFVYNPVTSINLMVMSKMPDGEKKKPEYISVRLVFTGLGRTLGILLLLSFPESNFAYVSALVIITASQYLLIYWARRIMRSLAAQEARAEQQAEKEQEALPC